jgi:hypothetical protein
VNMRNTAGRTRVTKAALERWLELYGWNLEKIGAALDISPKTVQSYASTYGLRRTPPKPKAVVEQPSRDGPRHEIDWSQAPIARLGRRVAIDHGRVMTLKDTDPNGQKGARK